ITYPGNSLEILVEDDGCGFDARTRLTAAAGFPDAHDGLRNMTRRFAEVGGQCTIASQPGHGTSIRFVLPLKPNPSNPP
ncbi:MAG TPA: ATP-binding protein, partial [Verrucomicrobiae bacterium]